MTDKGMDVISLVNLPDAECEQAFFAKMRVLDDSAKLGYGAIGIITNEVHKRLLWKYREGCTSMNAWIKAAAPWSYATCHAAMRDVQQLSYIPAADLAEIPASNFPIVKKLSQAVAVEPRIIEAAKNLPTRDFVEEIRERHPEQHFSRQRLLRYKVDEEVAVLFESAMDKAQRHGAITTNDKIELIALTANEELDRQEEFRRIEPELERMSAEIDALPTEQETQ